MKEETKETTINKDNIIIVVFFSYFLLLLIVWIPLAIFSDLGGCNLDIPITSAQISISLTALLQLFTSLADNAILCSSKNLPIGGIVLTLTEQKHVYSISFGCSSLAAFTIARRSLYDIVQRLTQNTQEEKPTDYPFSFTFPTLYPSVRTQPE